MKAKVSISQIYWNSGLASFFFRYQSMKTFEELVERHKGNGDDFLILLNGRTEDSDIDEIEELFYEKSVEEIADAFGITELIESDDDE